MKPFGENLEALMGTKNISVKQLAQKIGVSSKTCCEWIGAGGRIPRNLNHIKRLADLFEVSVHFLLFGFEDPRGSPMTEFFNKAEFETGVYEVSIKKIEKNNGGP